MLQQELQALRAHCERVFSTGDTESDFRARLVSGLAVLLLVLSSVLIVDDFLAGHLIHAVVLSLIPFGSAATLWLLIVQYEVDQAASTLVGTLFFVLVLIMLLTGGGAAGIFVAFPAIVLLASVLCSRAVAVAISVGTIGTVGLIIWLSTTNYSPPLLVEKNTIWMLSRVTIVVSLITMVSMFLYRDSAEHVRRQAVLMKRELEVANSEIASVLSTQLAGARLLHKVQELSDVTGWWYELSDQRVRYTTKGETEFRSFNLRDFDSEEDRESRELLGVSFRDIILARIDSTERWDDETRIADGSGGLKWYRDSGEVESTAGVIVRVVGVLQDITSTKALTDQLELHANYDELTGLCNRRMFWKAVQLEHASVEPNAGNSYLLFMDLDQFKLVNDTSGHVAGDRLLRIVADALKKNIHSDDVVGRVGGDEFGILIRNCTSAMAQEIAERMRELVEKVNFHWSGEVFRVSASIGAISIDPAHGTSEELQQLVDAACYEAKLAGRNRVNFFEGGEETIAAHRGEARWVQRLHDAMEHDRFELHGQLIQPARGAIEPERYEVLVRLKDEDSGRLIPPGAFLPAAERFGLAPQLDQWVIEHLLKNLQAHPNIDELNRRYWVNLSGNSVGDLKFAEYLIQKMSRCTLPKGMVNFEITETAVIRNIGQAGELISTLRSMGCQFALDDFGSGLSSFGYLKKLPIDYLKIDGMFVREILNDEADRVFVRAIISIAHAIGIKTVAEFVENDEIHRLVREFGVDYVQGYGVHRPEPLVFHQDVTRERGRAG